MEPIIEINNISKKYIITGAKDKYLTLRDSFVKFIKNPLGVIQKNGEFWALKNVSFNIAPGEAIGIIGANGAGKSTLLKILSRITPPTEGEIRIKGRVSSLLEVGTGFNLELSGRENIYLNGAILGMTKKEIEDKMDKIVEFSGVDKFLDTPIKRYSSGMKVRLAFSVAAHLDPDILIIDEVLAVGDAEFQKKCLGKMDEVVKKSGRTVLFVSHNMDAIKTLCSRAVLLKAGEIVADGDSEEVVEKYLGESRVFYEKSWEEKDAPGNDRVKLVGAKIEGENGQPLAYIGTGTPFKINLNFLNYENNINLNFFVRIFTEDNTIAFTSVSPAKTYQKGSINCACHIPADLMNTKTYQVAIAAINNGSTLYQIGDVLIFDVHESELGELILKHSGAVRPKLKWDF